MLFTRSLLSFIGITLFISTHAAPIASNVVSHSVVKEIDQHVLIDSFSEYYESIVDQIMLDVSEDVLSYLPQQMSNGNVKVRLLAQKSMERNLSFMRASLLASITPLVSTDIVQIPGLLSTSQLATVAMSTEYYGDQILTEDIGKIENDLLDSVLVLNKKISHQLGLIVNARQSSEILIRQVNSLSHNEEKPTVVTVEWKLRQPFQINIIREEETADVSLLSETEWLQKELYGVENMMLDEFNDHAQELIELIMENIALKMFL